MVPRALPNANSAFPVAEIGQPDSTLDPNDGDHQAPCHPGAGDSPTSPIERFRGNGLDFVRNRDHQTHFAVHAKMPESLAVCRVSRSPAHTKTQARRLKEETS